MTTAILRGDVDLSDDGERAVQQAAEHVGGYLIDPDSAAACSAARNLIAYAEAVLEACSVVQETVIIDRP